MGESGKEGEAVKSKPGELPLGESSTTLVTFNFACLIETDATPQKIKNYIVVGNVDINVASQILHQLMILETMKRATEDALRKFEEEKKADGKGVKEV